MSRQFGFRPALWVIALGVIGLGAGGSGADKKNPFRAGAGAASPAERLEHRFRVQVRPFLQRYCFACHGPKKHKGGLDLTRDATVSAVAGNPDQWELVLERLQAREMPPRDAPRLPPADERAKVVAWIRDLRDHEAKRAAGDPGVVLARRLSNAELDYTIRDLTGVDLRPAREFPVDPANEADFDNSGESLAMAPVLFKKYLAAVQRIADHVVLKPQGFVFAPHPVVTDTDRDKYCVHRIVDFYERHRVELADYFLAAWRFRHRQALGKARAPLVEFAAEAGISARYLATIWSVLTEPGPAPGPLGEVQAQWRQLPGDVHKQDAVRRGCERLRDLVLRRRQGYVPKVPSLRVKGISVGSQPLVLWRNRQIAVRHMRPATPGNTAEAAAIARFCRVFPDAFVVQERAPYYDASTSAKGRLLSAGFHLMHGYFRDDGPLYELVLNDRERRELDALWHELNFITRAPMRQYKDFIFFERAEPPRFMREAKFDFARSEDKEAVAQAKIERLAQAYLAKARKQGAAGEALGAIETYFTDIASDIRRVEQARRAAEPGHREALVKFTERAYRRPLAAAERDGVLAFYRTLRRKDGLGHEEALRDTLAGVLLSPHFYYRVDRAEAGKGIRPLSGYALASRLSYFLWSSMPDAELLAHAAANDLHRSDVLKAQVRRMLQDARVRGLATEFGANWLDVRRFEEHNSVDRRRFPAFTNELRQAMFEEPVRYFMDIAKRNRSVLDLLYGNDTFVNRVLARHYGMPEPAKGSSAAQLAAPTVGPASRAGPDAWVHIEDARRYGRGGLLPMAVFLTKNAPGLRTSPVKRGYWVVRRLLGERIPPPPPTVPELPKDEAKLGEQTLAQLLARHRADKNCAGCHRRFDAVGLVFEDFGPVGERRAKDLAGHPVQTAATFPDGSERQGLGGLREYLHARREQDFVDNLCRKLLVYALGRALLLSDRKVLDEMRIRLKANGYTFGSLVEVIVTSPQFVNTRGREDSREQ